MEHAKLPWRASETPIGIGLFTDAQERDTLVAMMPVALPDRGEANARYIVHAANLYPRLVDVCKMLLRAVPNEATFEEILEATKAAHEALAQCKEP